MNVGDESTRTQITTTPGNDLQPDWSAGAGIVFTTDDGDGLDIATVAPGGGDVTFLTTTSDNDQEPAWSPDGGQILFRSARGGIAELYVMNSDGSEQRPLFTLDGTEITPAWR